MKFILLALALLACASCRTKSDTEVHMYLDYETGTVHGNVIVGGVSHPFKMEGGTQ